MVKVRALSIMAAGLGLWLGGQASAQSVLPERPAAIRVSNQELANTVAMAVERSGVVRGYTIDITSVDGVVELSGKIADASQREAVLRTVLSLPGVASIVDKMTTLTQPVPATVRQAQLADVVEGRSAAPPAIGGPPAMLPAPGAANTGVDPIPLGQAAGSSPYDLNAPKMPGYAWPTYAPYNNFSRVGYPTNYPYNAWPYIGPFYPFPKVPLGWRSVTLEWQDGHWWMGRNATKYDYWRVRYW